MFIFLAKKCNHGLKEKFKEETDKSYFGEKYLKTVQYPVTNCFNCRVIFGINYKVSVAKPVFICENGIKSSNSCCHALCKPCYDKEFILSDNNKFSKRTSRRKY